MSAIISIHAPREGGDTLYALGLWSGVGFQSTPPARGATGNGQPPGSGRRGISIHAPREGGDHPRSCPR